MSYGDTRYEFYSASVNATNSSAVQTFFGTYSGLSLLNNDDVVHIFERLIIISQKFAT